jgi:hypothetical protein
MVQTKYRMKTMREKAEKIFPRF